eukprot:scaffold1583_cov123-Skeletonema_dohrnii-CCMP3373.AAC.4
MDQREADADVDGACWPHSSSPTFVIVVRQAVAPLSSVIVVQSKGLIPYLSCSEASASSPS